MPHAPPTVTIVDDDPTQRLLVEVILRRAGFAVVEHADGAGVLAAPPAELGVVCLDLGLADLPGREVLARLLARDPELAVIVITGDGEIATAVDAMRAGAHDYLVKPVDEGRLLAAVHRAMERRTLASPGRAPSARVARLAEPDLCGAGAAMAEVRAEIARVAPSNAAVCIRGETGVGKELVARAIHDASGRRGPFVAVNCAAIPAGLQESELFGHERGAFTGATALHRGRFEQAAGGTLFLDEIGEMHPATQASLLRALQERRIRRLGGSAEVALDVRVVSATHRDLEAEVAAGRFREDLYYRLVVYPIAVAPLRERREDLPALVAALVARISAELARPPRRVAPAVVAALAAHDWPGNIRELANVLHRALLASDGDELELRDLPAALRRSAPPIRPAPARVAVAIYQRGAPVRAWSYRGDAREELAIDDGAGGRR